MTSEPTESQLDHHQVTMGYHELLGIYVAEWTMKRIVLELNIEEKHFNRSGNVHGGVLTSMLDSALSLAGLYCASPERIRKGMTLSLTTTFVSPARSGKLRAIGELRGGGSKIFMSSGQVEDAQGNLIAMAEGTFRRRNGSESSEGDAT